MQNNAVEISKLYYSYPDEKNILHDINLKIQKNSFSVIIGPSGCGKTTLLMLIRGFFQEYGGTLKGKLHVLGEDITKADVSELGKKIGIIFQDPQVQLHQLRVIDEVASAPMYQGLPYEECQKRARKLIDQILGKEFYNKSPTELSGGQQQKVALAAALAMDCEILLLDEPFSFLDSSAAKEVLSLLIDLKKQGKTIIIATHGIEHISGIADELILMQKGEIILQGSPTYVLYNSKFEAVLELPLSIKTSKLINKKAVDWPELLKEKTFSKISRKNHVPYSNEIILSMDKVNFNYPETKKGLHNINLKLHKNEILGLIGSNGSGKTTLAKLILGLLKPVSGKLILHASDIAKYNTKERAKLIGYVTQDPIDMFFEESLLKEVAFGPSCLGYDNPEKIAGITLEKLNLFSYKNKHPDSLSGGQKSLLGIGDILANNPEILVLDEPEFGLDPRNWHKIVGIIKDLQKQGKTIIVITQDLEKSMFLCDRIVLLHEWEIIKIGKPKEIFTRKVISKTKLLPLPVFEILPYLPEEALDSEDDFVREVKKIW
ncbi:MAG: energy-coupling factor transporter ATPase [archaeon]